MKADLSAYANWSTYFDANGETSIDMNSGTQTLFIADITNSFSAGKLRWCSFWIQN